MAEIRKSCKKCGASKPLSEFYKNPRGDAGRRGTCKQCAREYAKLWARRRRDDPEWAEATRLYYAEKMADPKYRERRYQQHEDSKARHPERHRARVAVANAIKNGEIVRAPTCEDCGAGGPTEGHHEDYSRPLDVVWLCRTCHKRRHRTPVARTAA